MCDKSSKSFPTYRLPDKATGREEGEGGEEGGEMREDPFAAGDRFLSGVSWTSRGGRLCAVKDCGPPLLLQRNIILFVLRTHQKQTELPFWRIFCAASFFGQEGRWLHPLGFPCFAWSFAL